MYNTQNPFAVFSDRAQSMFQLVYLSLFSTFFLADEHAMP